MHYLSSELCIAMRRRFKPNRKPRRTDQIRAADLGDLALNATSHEFELLTRPLATQRVEIGRTSGVSSDEGQSIFDKIDLTTGKDPRFDELARASVEPGRVMKGHAVSG